VEIFNLYNGGFFGSENCNAHIFQKCASEIPVSQQNAGLWEFRGFVIASRSYFFACVFCLPVL